MKHLNLVLAIVVATALAVACKKSTSATAKTNTDLITQASWKFDNATVNGTDVSAFIQTCQSDNTITFAAAGTGTVDEGPTKCNSGDPQTDPFNWNFVGNDTLHVSTVLFSGGSSDFALLALTDTKLSVSQNVTVSGTTQMAVINFKH